MACKHLFNMESRNNEKREREKLGLFQNQSLKYTTPQPIKENKEELDKK